MRKTYILEDLDCAHCAALIEEKVGKLDGVTKSTVTLLTQKLVVEVEDDKAAGLLKEITKIDSNRTYENNGEKIMQYSILGKSQLKISVIGFGGIPIQRVTEEEAIKVVRFALDKGTFAAFRNEYSEKLSRRI